MRRWANLYSFYIYFFIYIFVRFWNIILNLDLKIHFDCKLYVRRWDIFSFLYLFLDFEILVLNLDFDGKLYVRRWAMLARAAIKGNMVLIAFARQNIWQNILKILSQNICFANILFKNMEKNMKKTYDIKVWKYLQNIFGLIFKKTVEYIKLWLIWR